MLKKKLCYPTLGLLLWLALQVGAHVGDRLYPIAYLSDEMLAEIQLDDGQIQEWIDLLGEPTLTLLDFTEEIANSPLDPSDLDFRIWLAWHDEPARLYLAFVASDDVYKNTHDYDSSKVNRQYVHMNDSIILTIDGDHSGGAGVSNSNPLEERIEIHGQNPSYVAISRTVSGPTLSDEVYRIQRGQLSWTTLPPYAESGGGVAGETPVIWVIELYVTPFDRWGENWADPAGSAVSRFAAGKVIGFTMVVFDYDSPPYDTEWRNWAPEVQQSDGTYTTFQNIRSMRADTFLDGLLLPADPAEPGDSSVDAVSWGRIKASLEFE